MKDTTRKQQKHQGNDKKTPKKRQKTSRKHQGNINETSENNKKHQ